MWRSLTPPFTADQQAGSVFGRLRQGEEAPARVHRHYGQLGRQAESHARSQAIFLGGDEGDTFARGSPRQIRRQPIPTTKPSQSRVLAARQGQGRGGGLQIGRARHGKAQCERRNAPTQPGSGQQRGRGNGGAWVKNGRPIPLHSAAQSLPEENRRTWQDQRQQQRRAGIALAPNLPRRQGDTHHTKQKDQGRHQSHLPT